MDNTFSAAPNATLQGIQDSSAVPPVVNPESLPTHLPHVFFFAATGPLEPQLVDTSALVPLYGADTFNYNSPFSNHATPLINVIAANGGSAVTQRLVPDDAAPPATLGLYLDIVAEPALPQWQRNVDGSFKLDVNGAKIQVVGAGATAAGYLGRWVVKTLTNGELKAGTVTAGSISNSASVQSQLYPIFEFAASFVGSPGNNLGVSLWAPTTESSPALNAPTVDLTNAYVYRLQFMQRPNTLASPNVVQTSQGEQSIEFSLAPGVIDPVTEQVLSYGKAVISSYQSGGSNGQVQQFSPFSDMYVYDANVLAVSTMIFNAEAAAGTVGPASPVNPFLINLLGAVNTDGVPYYNFTLQGPADNGLLFAPGVSQYASGGSDGTMSFTTFDALVANQVSNYGLLDFPFLDRLKYPQSVIYDTGYTIATKKALMSVLGVRKDMCVILSTQDVSQPQNSPSAESSIAVALRTALNLYPESTVNGTSVVRACIIGQSGMLLNSNYTTLAPLTLELAKKATIFMGAGNGIWKSGYGWNSSPKNQITLFDPKTVNATWKPVNARNNDWNTGLTWAQTYDRGGIFWPAVQTVYTDDSSVLNSSITMMACVELEKVCDRVWADLTGNDELTDAQFIERSNNLIDAKTVNRFDNRFIIKADTYFTAQDTAAGNRWSCKITIYGPTMKIIGSFTIQAARKDSLSAAS